ncbi:hypothetical protein ABFV99_14325 [Cytobacillus horneckiae]|uniref:hypothetical protein n=1 Tax=Cytobacillus horneckiae TaxID=549687 RepID=UPI0034CFEA4C
MYTQPSTLNRDVTAGTFILEEAGYVLVSNESYGDSKVSLQYGDVSSKLLLIPKYLSDDNFLYVSIDQENKLHIAAVAKGSEKLYGEINITEKVKDMNQLSVLSHGTRFTVFLNDHVIFKFESALFLSGSVRIAGEANEAFYSCEIEEPQSIAWDSNGSLGNVEIKVIKIDDVNYMKLISSGDPAAFISQSIRLTKGSFTLSFEALGEGKAVVSTSANEVLLELNIVEENMNLLVGRFSLPNDETIKITFETGSNLTVGKHQVEPNIKHTTYILNKSVETAAEREGALLSFPVKNLIDNKSGSLFLSLTPKSTFKGEQRLFWSDNNSLSAKVINSGSENYEPHILLTVGDSSVEMPLLLENNRTYNILVSWSDEKTELHVNKESVQGPPGVLSGTIHRIVFAEEESIKEEVILEEWALFNNQLIYEGDIKNHLKYAVMQSLFDGGISGQNVTWSEIPVAPIDHSPILVQKENGETLQKVSFFDHETGEYVTYNQEPFVYDGKSDYVEVAYKNLDEQFRDIAIRTIDGEKIGEPYRIDGKRFYFNLYDFEKPIYKNKSLFATYQVNDTYTIDYNIKAVDGYRINFAKHDGGSRIVYQEGNRYGEPKKLATMIDLNPIQNQNHEGFLYVTETINKTDSFRITATPDRLHADGGSSSTLIIEPLDYQGNFLSHSNLQVIAEKGFITRHISKDAVEAQKRSGQYLYEYYAPYIQSEVDGEVVEDYIWITDLDNQIGIGYKMLLRPVKEAGIVQLTNSDKRILTSKTTLINYLLMYEGLEKYEDELLFSILDLDQDDRITMNEVTVLESNKKDHELAIILNQLEEWEGTKDEVTTS